jgi:solute:Na+ symporter, SSS family
MVKYLLLFLFICMLVGSGWYSMRRTKTVGDFFLGNRTVGPWLSAFAYGTTYFSAVLFIGYAGKVGWSFGLSSLWIAVGNAFIGSFLAWRLLAKPTRIMTSRLGTMTMPGFLQARYDSPGLRVVSALIIFIFLVPYSASVYMGLSYLFEQTFAIPYLYGNIFMAVLTSVFLVMGGYLAVAITDFIQGIIMLLGVGMMLYFVLGHDNVGGIIHGLTQLGQYNAQLIQPVGPPGLISLISLLVLTSFGTWGLPQMIQKFYAIKDEKSIKPATIIASLFALVISVAAYGVGSLTRLFFDNRLPDVGASGADQFDILVPKMLSMALPEIGVVVILLLVLSASISTLSSLVLVSASAIAVDLRHGLKRNTEGSPALFRCLCLIFIGISLAIAVIRPTFILNLMALSWGTVAGAFLGPYLYGLFWRRTTRKGAWAGLLSGLAISISFSLYSKQIASFLHLSPSIKFDAPLVGLIAMLIPLFVVPVVSLITQSLPAQIIANAYGMEADTDICNISTQGEIAR